MKDRIATPVLNNLIKSAEDSVTETYSQTSFDTDEMMINASYNGIQDILHEVEVYMGQRQIALTDNQLTIIYVYLKKIYDVERIAVQDFKDAERYEQN